MMKYKYSNHTRLTKEAELSQIRLEAIKILLDICGYTNKKDLVEFIPPSKTQADKRAFLGFLQCKNNIKAKAYKEIKKIIKTYKERAV